LEVSVFWISHFIILCSVFLGCPYMKLLVQYPHVYGLIAKNVAIIKYIN
jgi:hypothetical protein